jgi:hypothetical protein
MIIDHHSEQVTMIKSPLMPSQTANRLHLHRKVDTPISQWLLSVSPLLSHSLSQSLACSHVKLVSIISPLAILKKKTAFFKKFRGSQGK